MPRGKSTDQMVIMADGDVVGQIDALAAALDRSRSEIVDLALRQYVDANAWQVERIRAGLEAARDGQARPAEEVFADLAERYGLTP